jgi:hypothetical protein
VIESRGRERRTRGGRQQLLPSLFALAAQTAPMAQQDRGSRALIGTTGALQRSTIRDPRTELRAWRGALGGSAQAHRHMLVPAPGTRVASFVLTARESVIATGGYPPQHGVAT